MAKRRANGEGSIRKRADGRWEGRYVAGHDANGKAIRKNVLGKSQAEVREKLQRAIIETRGLDVARSDEFTVETWAKTWFEIYAKPNIRPSTADYYKRFIDSYIVPQLGDIKLSKLTSRQIQKMYNEVKANGRSKGPKKEKEPGLSSSTVRGVHMMFHNCLDRAVKEKLIPSNPSEDCIIPKLQKKEMKILLPEHVGSYLKAAEERDVLPLFFLELTTGLRKGEIVALLWKDLDLKNKTLTVSKQAVWNRDEKRLEITRPKTETSIRRISVPQETIDLLVKEHAKHPSNPYMFPSPLTGEMYHPDSIVNIHKKILKDAGLEHIRFHDLRHTFATFALQNGVDVKTVSSMLGHFSAGFTLNTYAHATNWMQEEAAEKMGAFVSQAM